MRSQQTDTGRGCPSPFFSLLAACGSANRVPQCPCSSRDRCEVVILFQCTGATRKAFPYHYHRASETQAWPSQLTRECGPDTAPAGADSTSMYRLTLGSAYSETSRGCCQAKTRCRKARPNQAQMSRRHPSCGGSWKESNNPVHLRFGCRIPTVKLLQLASVLLTRPSKRSTGDETALMTLALICEASRIRTP